MCDLSPRLRRGAVRNGAAVQARVPLVRCRVRVCVTGERVLYCCPGAPGLVFYLMQLRCHVVTWSMGVTFWVLTTLLASFGNG